jgi:hypothetical protein
MINKKELNIIAYPNSDGHWSAQVEYDIETIEYGNNRDEAIGKLWTVLKATNKKYKLQIIKIEE